MTQFNLATEFAAQSQRARNLGELEHALHAATLELGFDFYALVQHVDIRKSNTKETVWLGNYPSSWITIFEERGLYANDPIHVASQHTSAGFAWSSVNRLIKLSREHKRVLGAASREGIGDGYTVPAHVPGESNGTCSFAMKIGRESPADSFMAAQLIGLFAMDAGRRITRNERETDVDRPRLTPRQLDCLVLVAKGKTDWEIAQILGIKESTVRDYIELACARYDVRRRMQLVLRALHDGHITLRDAIG